MDLGELPPLYSALGAIEQEMHPLRQMEPQRAICWHNVDATPFRHELPFLQVDTVTVNNTGDGNIVLNERAAGGDLVINLATNSGSGNILIGTEAGSVTLDTTVQHRWLD